MLLWGGSAKALFSIKTYIHLRNPEKKCPGPQNDCPGLKINPQAFKITAHLGVETPRRSTPRAQRNGTVSGYARSTLDSFNLFFRFLAEIHFRTIMQLPRKLSFETKTYSFGASITLP